MTNWVAIAYGALDMRGWHENQSGVEVMLLPIHPIDEPMGLSGAPAELWRRLVDGPVEDAALSREEQELVREFAEFGIASSDAEHAARITRLDPPWLLSPLHELVYALVASVARDNGIDAVFIKGPVLHKQGLRERPHSGDVDVWVDPSCVADIMDALQHWGWKRIAGIWDGYVINHSETACPGAWGCEIDVHRRFPGFDRPERQVFEEVRRGREATRFAGVAGIVPTLVTHAVIAAVHAVRPEIGQDNRERWRSGAALLRAGGAGTADAAARLGAQAVLLPALREVYPELVLPLALPLPPEWEWRAASSRRAAYRLILRTVPVRARPGLVWRFIWPSREVIRASDHLAGLQSKSIAQARWRRLRRGLASMR